MVSLTVESHSLVNSDVLALQERLFLLAGGSEGVCCVVPGGAPAPDVDRSFARRAGFDPDYAFRYGDEATRLLIAAVRRAGLNRAHIRDAIR
jgi:hypothetical protein